MGRPQETALPARPPGYWQERNSRLLQELWYELALSHEPLAPWDDMGPNPCVEDILEVLHHSGAKWRDFWAVFPYHFREQLQVLDDASVEALGVLLHSDAAKQRFQLFFDPTHTLASMSSAAPAAAAPAAVADGAAQQQPEGDGQAEGDHAPHRQQQAGPDGAAASAVPAVSWPALLPPPPALAGPVRQNPGPRIVLTRRPPPAGMGSAAARGVMARTEGMVGSDSEEQQMLDFLFPDPPRGPDPAWDADPPRPPPGRFFPFPDPPRAMVDEGWFSYPPSADAAAAGGAVPWNAAGRDLPGPQEFVISRYPAQGSAAAGGAELEAWGDGAEAARQGAIVREAEALALTLSRARHAAATTGAAMRAAFASTQARSQRAPPPPPPPQQQQQQQQRRLQDDVAAGRPAFASLQEALDAAPMHLRTHVLAGFASSIGLGLEGGIGPSAQDRIRAIGRARREVPLEQQPEEGSSPASPSNPQQLTGRARRYSMMVAVAPGGSAAGGQRGSARLHSGHSPVVATARATLQAPQRHVRPRIAAPGAGDAAGCSSLASAAGAGSLVSAPGSSPAAAAAGGGSRAAAVSSTSSSSRGGEGGAGSGIPQQPFRAVHVHLTREDEELVTLIQDLVPYDLSLVPQSAVQQCLQELCGTPGDVPQQLVLEVGRLIEATAAAVTLLVAGAGRTRSALAAAVTLAATPARRPLYVDLRGLFHAADVDAAVLQGLFAAEEARRREDQLVGHLKLLGLSTRAPLLLLLDQADLLLRHDGGRYATELLAQLLHLLPRAQLLITAAAEDAEGVLEDLTVVVVEEARWELPAGQGELHVQCYSKG